ncbi:MAG TPA: PGPGW domain-containing protein [Egicoccus sp.]|nr:PGPGW domain-containing protein [Egicoccus sp.]HSK22533.1 PGPGW domain-containing protein [Egicoccus sp.]
MHRTLRRSTRLVADTVLGYVLLGLGLVMLVTPGPGIVAMIAGLAVLGRHYRWAHRLRGMAMGRVHDAGTAVRARVASRRLAGPVTDAECRRDAA